MNIIAEKLASIERPNIVIVGAWMDLVATTPPPSMTAGTYMPDDPRYVIYAIEPIPHCVEELRRRAALRAPGETYIIQCAVSDFDGNTLFHEYQNNSNMTSSLRVLGGSYASPPGQIIDYAVEVKQLDTLWKQGLLPERADYLTLDVQGCALEAIRGGREYFVNHVTMAWVEVETVQLYDGQALHREVRDAMIDLGFKAEIYPFDDATEKQGDLWNDILFVKP